MIIKLVISRKVLAAGLAEMLENTESVDVLIQQLKARAGGSLSFLEIARAALNQMEQTIEGSLAITTEK